MHDRKVVEEYCKIWLRVLQEREDEVKEALVLSNLFFPTEICLKTSLPPGNLSVGRIHQSVNPGGELYSRDA